MRVCFLVLTLLVSNVALAETESVATSRLSNESVSEGQFHWLTHKCNSEEGDEIETTPQSPPLNVDDPATPGCNNWEINVVVDGDFAHSDNTWELPLLDINYGIGDNLQLKYEIPNVVSSTQDSNTSTIGNSKAGVKYQFYRNDESKLQFAVYPQVEFSNPGKTSSSDSAETHGTIVTLPLLMSKRIGRTSRGNVMLSANLGYNISSRVDTANFVSASIGVGAPLIKKISILAEAATEQAMNPIADDPRSQIVKIDVGLMSPIGKHFMIFGSMGKSLVASDEQDHTYFASGFRFLPGD